MPAVAAAAVDVHAVRALPREEARQRLARAAHLTPVGGPAQQQVVGALLHELEVEQPGVVFEHGDVADASLVRRLLAEHAISAVVHFAGKIQVSESVANPALYFHANVTKTLALLDAVRHDGPRAFLFSSSAAVYGNTSVTALPETTPAAPHSPYGMSKLAVELALSAYAHAYGLHWGALRYFNAAGAHPSGRLRESHEPETHLIPLAVDAAFGRHPRLTVYGTDYATPDGTCVRDYVHVCDLADAHLSALNVLARASIGAVNLGNGAGYSVQDVLACCERVLGRPVPRQIGPRRDGDPAVLVADSTVARTVLGWVPKRSSLELIVEDVARSRR